MLDRLYDFHSFEVIPRLGQTGGGRSRALPISGREHPQVSRRRKSSPTMIRDAGFERVTYRNLTGGIAAIHSGWRI